MRRINAVKDEDFEFEVVEGDNVVKENVTEILLLWDEVRQPGQSYQDRQNALRQALTQRWGFPVSKATTFFTLEMAFIVVADQKKTLFSGLNLKSLESIQQENQATS